MKITEQILRETEDDAKQAIESAKKIVEGKTRVKGSGFVTLKICQRHNIYTTSIHLIDNLGYIVAYFCNGIFWDSISGQKTVLF